MIMLFNIIRYIGVDAKWKVALLTALFTFHFSHLTSYAQDKIINPDISYAGTPRTCEIGGIAVEGPVSMSVYSYSPPSLF